MNYCKKANYTTIVNAQRRAGGGRLSFNNLNPTPTQKKGSQCDLFLNPPVGTILKEIWQNTPFLSGCGDGGCLRYWWMRETAGHYTGVTFFTYDGTKHNGHPLWIRNDDPNPGVPGSAGCDRGDNEIKKNSIYYDGNNWYVIFPNECPPRLYKYTETKKCLIPQSDYIKVGGVGDGVLTGFSRFSII
jgi:hypothetical protein